jgi:predicted nucleic acid-binding protein
VLTVRLPEGLERELDRLAREERTTKTQIVRRALERRLITTWPVITETSHLLDFDVRVQLDIDGRVADGGVAIHDLPVAALERIMENVDEYRDRPMDIADATLLVAAAAGRVLTDALWLGTSRSAAAPARGLRHERPEPADGGASVARARQRARGAPRGERCEVRFGGGQPDAEHGDPSEQ